MNPEREKQLLELLNHYDTSGVAFGKAKQEILDKGFSEAELVYGLYSAPFDGQPNKSRPDNPLRKFYEDNPVKADRLAKTLLLSDSEAAFGQMVANTGAAQFGPDTHSRAYYGVRLANRLGIPYFKIMALSIVLLIVAFKLNLPSEWIKIIFLVFNLGVNSIFAYRIFQEHRNVSKLRKEVTKYENTDKKD